MTQIARRYREWPLAGALAEDFSCVWRSDRGAQAPPPTVLPDGQADLLWIDRAWRIAGPDRVAQHETIRTTAAVVGFRFRPGRAAAWLGQPLNPLVNQRPALVDVAPAWERRLARLDPAADLAAFVREFALLQAAGGLHVGPLDPTMAAAYAMIQAAAANPAPVMPRLVTALEMSERTLRRRFTAEFGYGPKTMARVLRFQRFLALLQERPTDSLSAVAFAAGYADQAHLTRECAAFGAGTPGELALERRKDKIAFSEGVVVANREGSGWWPIPTP